MTSVELILANSADYIYFLENFPQPTTAWRLVAKGISGAEQEVLRFLSAKNRRESVITSTTMPSNLISNFARALPHVLLGSLYFGSPERAYLMASDMNVRPNLLVIIADDCTRDDTSLYGGQAQTPHLSRLASEGMKFLNCFQVSPMCSPTRHALYTAKHPVHSGAYPNHTFVKPGVTSVAHWLHDAGYRTALSGKTHINPVGAFPFEYLSDEYIEYAERSRTNPAFSTVDKFLGDCAKNATPFGLILCSNEPHSPWNKGDASAYPPDQITLPPIFFDTPSLREEYSCYLAEITYFDSQVGEALALLDKHGLRENTIVFVTTEQGSAFPFAKWTCYDAGVGTALVVSWPGHIEAGSETEALVELTDVMPTFLEAAGIAPPEDLDGRSFLPVLLGLSQTHREHVFSLQTSRGIFFGPEHYGIRSVRDSRFRYIRNLSPEATFKNWTTMQPWFKEWAVAGEAGDVEAARLAQAYQQRPAEELYDCHEDPWNQNNLISNPSYAPQLDRLRQALANWMEDQGDLGQVTEMDAIERMLRHSIPD